MTVTQSKFSRILLLILTILYTLYGNIATADSGKAAEDFISSVSDKTLKIIQSKISEEKKITQLEGVFIESVDINWMAKFAIAKFWKNMSDGQKDQYLSAYKRYLIKTYVPKFKEYNHEVVKITGSKDIGNGQYQVMTQIIATKGSDKTTLNISYRCKEDAGIFKIRDITGEDFSLLSTQRSEFTAIIEKGGVDKLIATLENK